MVFGFIALYESVRLYPLRVSLLAGDHALPGILGVLLIILGTWYCIMVKLESIRVEFPERNVQWIMFMSFGLMLAYCFMIPLLGYTISTFLISIGLFRIYGRFKWLITVMSSGVSTTALYVVFIKWLNMPFPAGVLVL